MLAFSCPQSPFFPISLCDPLIWCPQLLPFFSWHTDWFDALNPHLWPSPDPMSHWFHNPSCPHPTPDLPLATDLLSSVTIPHSPSFPLLHHMLLIWYLQLSPSFPWLTPWATDFMPSDLIIKNEFATYMI